MGRVVFHLAFPVNDLERTRQFYMDGLGCTLGRKSPKAITLELGGHQLVAHLTPEKQASPETIYPRHFGLIFTNHAEWKQLADRAKNKGLRFYREPGLRFEGTRIEHSTFFLEDPSHNLLEFKHYTYESAVFGEKAFEQVGESGGKGS